MKCECGHLWDCHNNRAMKLLTGLGYSDPKDVWDSSCTHCTCSFFHAAGTEFDARLHNNEEAFKVKGKA